ncbi:MAG TPA: hypothetical protein PLK67_17035 [Bryobacteraceae bacterium]|nr:hypothetical protein [Bryobacteraceae bacterium]
MGAPVMMKFLRGLQNGGDDLVQSFQDVTFGEAIAFFEGVMTSRKGSRNDGLVLCLPASIASSSL